MDSQTPALPSILAIEDNKLMQKIWKRTLAGRVNLLQVYSLEEATTLLRAHNLDTLSCIIMDGCLGGSTLDTLPLIDLICVKGFKGELIAASSKYENNCEMLKHGCTIAEHEKSNIPSVILQVLDLHTPAIA